jgi:predicted nucleotidyltransferase
MKPPVSEAEIGCLRSLLKAAAELGVPVISVGATARWLVFNLPNDIPLHRTTTDWDFGVRVADWTVFQQLRQRLLEQSGPFTAGRHQHEFNHKASGIRIDLVPFGGLENDGRILWPDTAFEMTVFGFSDALANAVEVELAPDVKLPVASVPLLVALKFFVFADRKNNRDLSDLWHVMRNYVVDGRESEPFDPPLSEVIDDQFDWDHVGSLLLGYDVGRASHETTIEKLIPILQGLMDPYANDISPLISRRESAEEEETERQRVSASFFWLLKGLQVPR